MQISCPRSRDETAGKQKHATQTNRNWKWGNEQLIPIVTLDSDAEFVTNSTASRYISTVAATVFRNKVTLGRNCATVSNVHPDNE